jgi:hypothetical protein
LATALPPAKLNHCNQLVSLINRNTTFSVEAFLFIQKYSKAITRD